MSGQRPALSLLAVLQAALVLGFTVVRDTESPMPILWPTATVPMVLQQDGSDDIDDGSDLEAIRAAMAAWNAVTDSAATLQDGGMDASRADGDDGVNRVVFVESNWPGGASGAGALTSRYRDTNGNPDLWYEADILMNGQDYTWATDGTIHAYDIQSIAAHEFGHVLGLNHAAHPEATMFFAGHRGTTHARTLTEDDANGVRYLFPSNTFACHNDGDCPAMIGFYGGSHLRLRCDTGDCVSGRAPYGAACFANADCESDICLLDPEGPPPTDPGFCTLGCSAGSCPWGDLCADTNGSMLCLLGRVNCWDVRPASNPDSPDCPGANNYCIGDVDGRYRCRVTCVDDANCGAVAGARCHDPIDADTPGFCREPGSVVEGACDSPLDCQTLVCATDPSGNGACVPGQGWQDGGPWPSDDGDGGGGAGVDGNGGDSDGLSSGGGWTSTGSTSRVSPQRSGCSCSASSPAWLLIGWLSLTCARRRAKRRL